MNTILNKLTGYALSLCKNEDKAQDLVQDSLESFLTAYPDMQWDSPESLPLLNTIIKNAYLDTQKKKSEVLFSDMETEDSNGDTITYEPMGTYGDVNYEDVYTMITSLRPKLRHAADLVLLKGLSHAEAARAIGISETALSARIYKVKKIIQQELED